MLILAFHLCLYIQAQIKAPFLALLTFNLGIFEYFCGLIQCILGQVHLHFKIREAIRKKSVFILYIV